MTLALRPMIQRRRTLSALLLVSTGLLAAQGCTTDETPSAASGGSGGTGGTGGTGGSGGAHAGAAGEAPGGQAGAAGASVEVPEPEPVLDGDVKVTCTVSCGDGETCDEATVFVSACAENNPGLCYEVTPVNGKNDDGNTYIVSVDDDGDGDVLESAECTTASEGEGLSTDLLFVIDSTSSMANAINGVLTSIDSFVDGLAEQNLDLRIGAIAFGNTAPLAGCVAPDAPFIPFTDEFGEGTEEDPESFNYWLSNLSIIHCGDIGGSDIPENGLDALGFALGHDTSPDDGLVPGVFEWGSDSLHLVVFITDATQHQAPDSTLAHFSQEELSDELSGFAVVHVVGPNYGCYNTPAAGCACNTTQRVCDTDCECDLLCPRADCPEDALVGVCDVPGTRCDPDCPGYPEGSSCDVTAGVCNYAEDSTTEVCKDDIDCAGNTSPLSTVSRRCDPTSVEPFADVGELTLATGGVFTTLPANGIVDLTTLPLTGVLKKTEECEVALPKDARSVRCVYSDGEHKGEVSVDLK